MTGEWSAVALAIKTRLAELGWTQQELSQRSQVSVATIRQLQNDTSSARRRNPRTLTALSEALGWSPDHLAAVADGRDPAEDPDADDPIVAELATIKESLAIMSSRLDAIEQQLADGDEPERDARSGG